VLEVRPRFKIVTTATTTTTTTTTTTSTIRVWKETSSSQSIGLGIVSLLAQACLNLKKVTVWGKKSKRIYIR
jgi:hypothetical protein